MRSSGAAYGVCAYALWGLFPLYIKQLSDAGEVEILAHRVVWSLVVVAVIATMMRTAGTFRGLGRRVYGLLTLAAALITINWGTYIWAVTSDQIVEAALGYFINPLLTVALGVVVLRERLRAHQWFAMGLAALGVAVLTIGYGRPPWIALVLAFSFGTYGLIKKKADVSTVTSLGVETAILFPCALTYLVALDIGGDAAFAHHGWGTSLLLAGSGLATAVPLLFFGAAAVRVPLSVLGPLQYITPTSQFLLGVVLYDEHVSSTRMAGFVLIWLALAVLTAGLLSRRWRRPSPATTTGTPTPAATATTTSEAAVDGTSEEAHRP